MSNVKVDKTAGGPYQDAAFRSFRRSITAYFPLSDDSWRAMAAICRYRSISKKGYFCSIGQVPTTFAFVHTGLLRAFVTDENGNEYNKIFFTEDSFPGSMAALLLSRPSAIAIQALENSQLLLIDFKGYRHLLNERHDLKMLHIHYLEQNWLIAKEAREVSLVQEDALQRYRRFLHEHPGLESRVPQYHIASHLGITPTQLSRVRKKIKQSSE